MERISPKHELMDCNGKGTGMQDVQASRPLSRLYPWQIRRQQSKEQVNAAAMHTIGFILEQGLGHRTHTLNLQSNVGKDRSVNAVWGLIEQDRQGMLANLPFYNRYWTFQAGLRRR